MVIRGSIAFEQVILLCQAALRLRIYDKLDDALKMLQQARRLHPAVPELKDMEERVNQDIKARASAKLLQELHHDYICLRYGFPISGSEDPHTELEALGKLETQLRAHDILSYTIHVIWRRDEMLALIGQRQSDLKNPNK